MFAPYIALFSNPSFLLVFKILYYLAYVFVPVAGVLIIWDLWLIYRRTQFFQKQTYVLLEIKLPREIPKSPKAAEFFIAGMYQTVGEADWYEKYWKGQTRATFSLEIASIDGNVHFYIWTRSGARNQIEANIYSQFPGIEIYEVPDYTLPVGFDPDTTGMWASEFDLTKSDAYPIKTYVDYDLQENPDEEFKIDPITPLIEFLGSLGRGQNAWIQIILRAHKAEDKDPDGGSKKVDLKWAKAAKKEIDDIIKKAKGDGDKPGRLLTKGETETIAALERSISKPGFDVGIRTIYIAPKDSFSPSNIGGIIGGITHFNSFMNGFKPARGPAAKWKYLPWKDRNPNKIVREKQRLLDAYKRRAYFYRPYKKPHFVLNAEELATMYHFPGGVSATPTFSRIESRKVEAPSNLPI